MVMENEVLDNREYADVSFSNDELLMIKRRFHSHLYYHYERIGNDRSSLKYIFSYVPFFMQGDDWKFVCSGIKIYIDKIEINGVIEYTCDVYLNGVKYVDGISWGYFIKSSHFSNVNLSELMDELLSILSEYHLFMEEHRVEHISF